MRVAHLVFLALSPLAAATALAETDAAVPRTLAGCAELLPAGQVYSFEITGRIDATGAAPVLTGEMAVDDGTELDRSAETVAFQQCVASLIR